MIKKLSIIIIIVSAMIVNSCTNPPEEKEITLSVSGAFALYPLMQKWAEEYTKMHPDIKFNIQAGGAGKGLLDVMSGAADIGMFSRAITEDEKQKGFWWIALCKEAVLPTINQGNPYMQVIEERGLTKKQLQFIFTNKGPVTWDSLFAIPANKPTAIKVITRKDAAGAAESWAAYLGLKQLDLQGIAVEGDPALADSIRNNKNAIGYNNSFFVYDNYTGEKYAGIEVVPIDINDNGKIDKDENFYNDLSVFLEAVHNGKFPSPPARDLYFITKGRTQQQEILDFFKWALTDGQKMLYANGYVPLEPAILKEQVRRIYPGETYRY